MAAAQKKNTYTAAEVAVLEETIRKRLTMRTLPTPVNLCDNRLHLEKL